MSLFKDNCLFIDNSALETLQTCPRAFEYSQILRRILATENAGLMFGELCHLVLEHRFRRCGNKEVPPEVESEQAKIIEDFFSTHTFPEDDFRNANWAMEIFVTRYNQRYGREQFDLLFDKDGKPLIEVPFCEPLTQIDDLKVFYTGKIDLPLTLHGQILTLDNKTSSVLDSKGSFFNAQRINPQFIGYCWAMHRVTGIMPSGFEINAIRTSPPPDYVLENKKKGRYDPDEWWAVAYQRHKEYLQPWMIPEWERNVIALVEELVWNMKRNYLPQKKCWCVGKYGVCQYYSVCDTPPTSRGIVLESNMFKNNDWSPLKQPK